MSGQRQSRGNMILFVTVIIALIIALGVAGMICNRILLERNRTQYGLDSLALDLASKINVSDRLGQINQLVEASREIVFTSRQARNTCSSDDEFSDFQPLCDLLLEEARSGQYLVEQERKNQITVVRREILEAIKQHENNRQKKGALAFLSVETSAPQCVRVDLGNIDKVDSNIRSLDAIPELRDFDRRQGYVDSSSRLMKSDINVSLPDPDSDLNFRFCSLPAFVSKTCSPPRNANDDSFRSLETIYFNGLESRNAINDIPSAIQIKSAMDVSLSSTKSNLGTLGNVATGVCSGASAESE